MQKLTISTLALVATLGAATASHAQSGEFVPDVTFDCKGSVNFVVRPNSNAPSAFGVVQAFVDLPGGRTGAFAGTIELGPDRGDNVNVRQQSANIDRCAGRANLTIGACSNFNGLTSCAVELKTTNARIRLNRGGDGFITFGTETSTLMRGQLGFITFGEPVGT